MAQFSVSARLRALLVASVAFPLAVPAVAQEATRLDTITVEDDAVSAAQETGGLKGETIAREATVGKSDRPILETPRAVSVVTEQRLEDQGVEDISDALLYVPGVYSETYGPDTRVDSKLIRGVAAPHFLDGLRHNFGFYNTSRVDPYTLSAVEVIKGPVGALYGGGALGGIVNLTSKLPQEEAYREMFIEVGTHDRKRTGFDFTGPIDAEGDFLYRLVGAIQNSGTQVDFVDDNGLFVMPSITWQPTEDTKLTLLGLYQKDDGEPTSRFVPIEGSLIPTDNGNFVDSDTFLGEPGFDRYDTEKASITALFEHRFNEIFSLDLAARYTDSSVAYDQIYPFPWVVTGDSVDRILYSVRNYSEAFVADSRLNADFQSGPFDHQISVGTDYQFAVTRQDSYNIPRDPVTGDPLYDITGIDMINPTYGMPIPPLVFSQGEEQQISQTGFYIYDQIAYDEKLFLSLGLRHDWFSDQRDIVTEAFTGNVGVLYWFDSGIAPYVSYATAFEPVGVTDPNFTYAPTRGEQWEAGVKYQPPETPHLFTVSAFNIDLDGREAANPANPRRDPSMPWFIQTDANIRGFEFEAQTRIRDFELLAGYTYLDTEDKSTGFQLASVPTHQASGWVTWRPQGNLEGWVFGGGVRYVGASLDGRDNFETPSYVLGDLMVGYETERWTARLNVQNITDEKYLTTCLARGDCFYGQRRNVNFKLTTRF